MKPTEYIKLENDKIFKKKYLRETRWWLDFAVIPPSLILFLGLFGLLYLAEINLLLSYYSIPLAIVFTLGTIWLKSVKRYIQNKNLENTNAFKVCLSVLVGKDKKYSYFIFTNGEKRHNEYFIKEVLKAAEINYKSIDCKKKVRSINIDKITEEPCFIKAYQTTEIKKQNINWRENESLPILYINKSNTFIIKGKDLK